MARLIALICALVLGLLTAWVSTRTPGPARADAPATRFSAARAMTDVRAVAARPHPVGSAENRAVRDQLIQRMTALGLSPTVRQDRGVFRPNGSQGAIVGGRVDNIVGVLPGLDRNAPGVALLAHYDSAAGSPGAGDDAAGVAAILETVRAIRAAGTPPRNLFVILTDGEEAGLLGAEAFFNRDPLAARIDFVINLEARGGGGRVQMFQTGRDPGASVRLF